MTRSTQDVRSAAPRSRSPRGVPSPGATIIVILSIVGLAVIAAGTLALGSGDLPFTPGGPGPGASGAVGPAKTATPSNVVIVPTEKPGIKVPGTLVYAKDGNVWLQSNGAATQLTNGGTDSMPSFTPDGASVLFVRTRSVRGFWPVNGVLARYDMDVPSLMEVPVAGGNPTTILDGLVNPAGQRQWMGFIRQPRLSPDGRTIAIASDLPDPTKSDVTIKLVDAGTHRLTDPHINEVPPLGHQDPAWSPDGKQLLYVQDNRNGAQGTPQIYSWDPASKRTRAVTAPGYLHPSWSPDGRYIAATRTSAYGTDVVILSAATGAEVARLTSDGASWAPAWSPAGDEIAFLHVAGQVVDLRMIQLTGTAPNWTVGDPVDLTSAAGLDGVSRPDWFVPLDQRPTPAAPPASPSSSGAASPSAGPATASPS